jgi:hypothetical protein
MVAPARTPAVRRLAAGVVALALSGVPAVAALHAPAPVHRCACASAGPSHDCSCSRCHGRAGGAAGRGEGRSPPCHASAARTAPAPARDGSAPCLTGSCGSQDPATAALWALDAFTIPVPAKLGAPVPAGSRAPAIAAAHELVLSPEAPPPRAA